MFKRLLSVGGFTLLSRITGFIRDVLMAAILGSGFLSDSFLFAFLFPNYFRAIFGEGTINPAFLPRYAALHAKGEDKAAALFADRVFSWQMAAQLLLLALGLSLMPYLVDVFQAGYPAQQRVLITALARITFPYLILTVAVIQLSAMLNAIEKFWAAAAWSNLWNLSMIATLLAARWFPNAAYAAAWGSLLGGVMQLIFMLGIGRREGLKLRFAGLVWTPEIREFFKAFGMVTFGAASVVVAPLIDFFIASYLPVGSRTALYYADRINQLPLGVLGIALGTVVLPEMSRRLAQGDRAGSDAAQNRSAAMSLLLTLPFVVTFLLIPDTIMRAIFAHGHFDRGAASLAGQVLAAYGVGLPAMALVRIIASTFYARHDTTTPVLATVTAMICNISLKVLFVWGFHWGLVGVALGTALGAWINVGVLTWYGHSRMLLAIEKNFLRSLGPALLAALVCGACAWAGAQLGNVLVRGHYTDLAALAFAMLCAAIGYGAVVLVFRRSLPLGQVRAMRLFVALALPETVAQSIMLIQSGVPGARWQAREQLHLTLRFIGEVDGRDAAMLDDALAGILAPGFSLQLHGVGQFGNKQPHTLWAGVRPNPALEHLQRKVDSAIRRVGRPQDAHKFMPHVTLARLRHPEAGRMLDWLTYNALYTSPEFPVAAFQLYSSKLTSDGSIYRIEQSYDLENSDGETDD